MTRSDESGSFRPGSFRPTFGVGRFGLRRWVVSALSRFGQISIGGRDRGRIGIEGADED